MGKVLYSLSSEGRGHAARAQAVIDLLDGRHEVCLLASGEVYSHLSAAYRNSDSVHVRRLPGLFFAYRGEKLDYCRSILGSVPYLRKLNQLVAHVQSIIEHERPDIGITDFEPALPRAAGRCGLPWISLDHQHFLTTSNFSTLPAVLRVRALLLRLAVPMFYRGQQAELVSSFYHLPPRRGTEHVLRIGVLLRRSVLEAALDAAPGPDVVAYVRRKAPQSLLTALRNCGRRVWLYGQGEGISQGDVHFCAFDPISFIHQLSVADCLVTTAGNQLVGEALYLRKPVLAIPEEGNFEQSLNAHLLARTGLGWTSSFPRLTPHVLQQFLVAVPAIRDGMLTSPHLDALCGNATVKSVVSTWLPGGGSVAALPCVSAMSTRPEPAPSLSL